MVGSSLLGLVVEQQHGLNKFTSAVADYNLGQHLGDCFTAKSGLMP